MKKYRDPRKNKERDYENYHFTPGKYDKAFRKQWPKRKARGHRLERRKVNTILDDADMSFDNSVDTEVKIGDVKPQKPVKWGTRNLRERIRIKMENRKRGYRARIIRRSKPVF